MTAVEISETEDMDYCKVLNVNNQSSYNDVTNTGNRKGDYFPGLGTESGIFNKCLTTTKESSCVKNTIYEKKEERIHYIDKIVGDRLLRKKVITAVNDYEVLCSPCVW